MCTVSEDMLSGGNATGSRSKYLLFSDEYIKEKNGMCHIQDNAEYHISLFVFFIISFYSELVCVKVKMTNLP